MRRLLITLGFPPAVGGMQAYLHQRCRAAPAHEIQVLAPSVPNCEAFDKEQPFAIHRWSSVLHPIPGIRRFMQVVLPLFHAIALYRRWRFGMVECGQALPLGLIGRLLKETLGTPYLIWTFGRDVVKPQRYPLSRWLLRLYRLSYGRFQGKIRPPLERGEKTSLAYRLPVANGGHQ